MDDNNPSIDSPAGTALAARITHEASRQTYLTVRYLVDRGRAGDAFRAYAYFRWVDDRIDEELADPQDALAFVDEQRRLMEACYQSCFPADTLPEEALLVDLIRGDGMPGSGLHAYIHNMMAVMDFDAGRRGRLIGQEELAAYTRALATAVTEALHYFVGHDGFSPHDEFRYLAASGAHIVHMLRDTFDDTACGYYNIPREVLQAHAIGPQDVESPAYRAWVRDRVRLARACFRSGSAYLARVQCLRCRVAGYAYIARFLGVLDAIESDGYRLRADYAECRGLPARLGLGWSVLCALLGRAPRHSPRPLPAD